MEWDEPSSPDFKHMHRAVNHLFQGPTTARPKDGAVVLVLLFLIEGTTQSQNPWPTQKSFLPLMDKTHFPLGMGSLDNEKEA